MKERQQTRRRRVLYAALAALALLMVLFLPGPNGVVRVLGRRLRARQLAIANRRLETDIDSLRARARWLSDPDSATDFARRLLGADSAAAPDTTGR